ncbi:MAG: hypothetical protein RSA53_07555 [Odoribacter sp.]
MINHIRHILMLACAAFLGGACADDTQSLSHEQELLLETICATLDTDAAIELPETRVTDLNDPSRTSIADRGTAAWKLNIQLYKANQPYTKGAGTFTYVASQWTNSGTTLFFPNYLKQNVDAILYPSSGTFDGLDQSDKDKMLLLDTLYTKQSITPAHIIQITLKHAESMLDFTFEKEPDATNRVKVTIGAKEYIPFVNALPNRPKQYLLILPAETKQNPEISVTTGGKTIYTQTVKIIHNAAIKSPDSLGLNQRYIFILKGNKLELLPISVANWTTGEAIAGDYIAVTAYPTFRGPAFATYRLTFDNELTQELTFNARKECTVKPLGRIITQIEKKNSDGSYTLLSTSPIILTGMIISLPE